MSYRKFDDAPLSRANEQMKLDPVFPYEALRRALQGVLNRVIAGTGGTGDGVGIGTAAQGYLGTGATCGVQISKPLLLLVNGLFGTAAACNNIYLPDGSQSKSTYVKYGVFTKPGSAMGTCLAGNESTASTTAKLPDCPDGYVCVGYMEYATGTAGAFKRVGGGTAGAVNVVSGNAAGTCGTVNAWVCLAHMPMSEL